MYRSRFALHRMNIARFVAYLIAGFMFGRLLPSFAA